MHSDFRLGDWLVSPNLNTISTNGTVIKLEPRVMEVLLYLSKNAGEVISKKMLIETVWAERFVTDEVITTSIFELRKALGDEAKNPRFIQTISKRGYRLIAPVQVAEERLMQPNVTLEVAALDTSVRRSQVRQFVAARRSSGLWKLVVAAVFAMLMTFSFLSWRYFKTTKTRTDTIASPAMNREATAAYTDGQHFVQQMTETSLTLGIEQFEKALKLAPNYAQAYAGLADAYSGRVSQNNLSPDEGYEKARAASLAALRLNEQVAEAHAALGLVKFCYDWDWEGAESEFQTAIAINPDYYRAHLFYSQYLLAADKPTEALAEIERALALNPDAFDVRFIAGAIYYRVQQYDRAIAEFRYAEKLNGEHPSVFKSLGKAYEKRGQLKEAEEAFQRSLTLSKLPPATQFSKDFAKWTKNNDRQFLLRKLSFIFKQRYVRPSYIAGLYAYYGESELAFDWLERAFQERDSNLLFLKTDESWNKLRTNPRFIDLEKRVFPAIQPHNAFLRKS
jgi:DNA-binding winged helix-turn-helix (wHTH) protein/tetratricopeptide (TPR) repeat protein